VKLENLNTTKLIKVYSEIITLLKERKVIRTKNLIGDLGEYLAIEHFNKTSNLSNLQEAPAGTQNIDAISRDGERYSVKSTTNITTGVFHGLEPKNSNKPNKQKFEYVLIMKFNNNYEIEKIIQLDWKLFLKHKKWHKTMNAWNLTITKSLIEDSIILYEKDKAYQIKEIQKKHKNAYEAWTNEEDERLESLFCEKKNTKELSLIFKRKEGAIRSRIKKLELKEKYQN
jgi:hypothetical protein